MTGKQEYMTGSRCLLGAALVASLGLAGQPAGAQTPPDAGQILRELAVPPQPMAPGVDLDVAAPDEPQSGPAGGERVVLLGVRFEAATRFSQEELAAQVQDAIGAPQDLAGLRDIARRITRFYRARGYPFARAYLPPQQLAGGELRVRVIEGRYGRVTATGDAALAGPAQDFLAGLEPGAVIEQGPLERAALLLSDLPGVRIDPVVRPGQAVGTGDFVADLAAGPALEGQVIADNYGNRYSGRHRGIAAFDWNSPFTLGDRLSATAMLTDEDLWFGQIAYSRPLGGSGLRGQLEYAHTAYDLGKEFAALQATGTARVARAGLSYPLVRSSRWNLSASAHYQHKWLRDEYGALGLTERKTSDALALALRFDARDDLGGGGITYGVLGWTPGTLHLDSPQQRVFDRLTARTQGGFQTLRLDVARLQHLAGGLSLFARFSGQAADKNLDSSERFSLGGPQGVRAYPQGEAPGDIGWLGQVELRYTTGAFQPYAFFDAGWVQDRVSSWGPDNEQRRLSGAGAGVRWSDANLSLDASLAWSLQGGDPQSDSRRQRPLAWVRLAYRF